MRSSPSTTTSAWAIGRTTSRHLAVASSWTQDGTTWTFKIDPDLTWSDGTPATSEDARWTLQTVLDVQARDGYVGSGYLGPLPDLRRREGGLGSGSADAGHRDGDAEHADPDLVPPDPAQAHLGRPQDRGGRRRPAQVGTGPYQVTEWKPGEYVHLVRNEGYWGPRGYADEIFLQYFADEGR